MFDFFVALFICIFISTVLMFFILVFVFALTDLNFIQAIQAVLCASKEIILDGYKKLINKIKK